MKNDIDHQVAEKLFGWRWLAYHGRPTRDAPNYPEERQVRRFFPPDSELHPAWFDHFAKVPHAPAVGDEPLDYCYCSFNGQHEVPRYSSDRNAVHEMEVKIHELGLWDKYIDVLARNIKSSDTFSLMSASCKSKCKAAIKAAG